VFLSLPGVYQWLVFLSVIKVVELLFSSVDPVVVDLFLALWAMMVCVFLFFFLWFREEGSTQEA
jgi:hypothetical protein